MQRLLTVLALSLSCAAANAAGFIFSNTQGPHQVGWRVQQQYDYSRVFKTRTDLLTAQPSSGERARPVQALVWYPAAGKGAPVRYRDYLATIATEADFTLGAEQVTKSTDALIARSVSRAAHPQAQQEVSRIMWAQRDAAPKAGRFPVVIYAPSLSASAAENTDLCEYLASHGYIVLSSPSMGPRARPMTTDLEGLESQAGDIGFLIAQAQKMPQADMASIAVVGFSWGGLANVIAAARDDRIGAVVSLDGSLRGYPEFIDGGKDAAKYVAPARVAIPLLYIAKRPLTPEQLQRRDIQTAYSFINRMKYSDVYVVSMYPMDHADFSSDWLRFAPDSSYTDYTRDEAAMAHSWTARYVQRFLDAYLKRDAAALAFLSQSPKQNGAPAHMMSLDVKRASAEAPTMENFVRVLARQGFAEAVPVYERFHADDASFALDSNSFNQWGYQLLRAGRDKDGLEIFKLAVQVHPKDGNLFDSLAEAYEKSGDKTRAIASYQRSLELWPANTNAQARLKALGASASAGAAAPGATN